MVVVLPGVKAGSIAIGVDIDCECFTGEIGVVTRDGSFVCNFDLGVGMGGSTTGSPDAFLPAHTDEPTGT